MNRLLTRSGLSLESFESERSPSIISFATDTSTDTLEAHGIGTLIGRVIYDVGDVPLRAFENLVIRRQLEKVLSAFPHEDDVVMRDIEIIYDHTLELSRYLAAFCIYQVDSENQFIIRFGCYDATIRTRALRALLVQIATGQTRHLLRSLVKWPSTEVAIFISEISSCIPDCW
jgi:hypothetical protein